MNNKKTLEEQFIDSIKEYMDQVGRYVKEIGLENECEECDEEVELDITRVDLFKPLVHSCCCQHEDEDEEEFEYKSLSEEDWEEAIEIEFLSREEFAEEVRKALNLKAPKDKKIIVDRTESINGYVVSPAKFAEKTYNMQEAMEILSNEEGLYDLLRVSDKKILNGVVDLLGELSYIEKIDEEDMDDYIEREKVVFSERMLEERYLIINSEEYIHENDIPLLVEICSLGLANRIGFYSKEKMKSGSMTSEEFLKIPVGELLNENMLWYIA